MKREVPCKLQGRAAVEKYLRDMLAKKIPAGRIENEGAVYEMLGLVPVGFKYLDSIIRLYTEQLGGYYDPDSDSYVMADWLPDAMQMSIAVHELTHALQDQHFDLDSMMDEINDPSDVLMARSALVEGDATLVMVEYARETMSQPPLIEEKSVSGVMMQNIAGAMMSASLSKAPPALQAMLIFPYVSGLRFVHALAREQGVDKIDRAFKNPPQSTEEILHPEKYFAKKRSFSIPELPPPPKGATVEPGKAPFEDRLGEFVISTLLGTYVSPLEASSGAAGWGGDLLGYFPRKGERYGVLLWRTLWDTEREAKEFQARLVAAYTKRFDRSPELSGGASLFEATPVGTAEISRAGSAVDLKIY